MTATEKASCAHCDGPYIESPGPDWEDYGGYAHASDCGMLVFAAALVAALVAATDEEGHPS